MRRKDGSRGVMRVLLVDDDPADALLVRIMLEKLSTPVRVQHVHSASEGLAYLRHQEPFVFEPTPDFVLLDLNMPGSTGFDMLAAMRSDEELARTSVVVLTTSHDPNDEAKALQLGAVLVLRKKADIDEYQGIMESLEQSWRGARDVQATR